MDVAPAVEVAAALGKSGWDGLPARYKMVVASSVAFMVCNMVRNAVCQPMSYHKIRHMLNSSSTPIDALPAAWLDIGLRKAQTSLVALAWGFVKLL